MVLTAVDTTPLLYFLVPDSEVDLVQDPILVEALGVALAAVAASTAEALAEAGRSFSLKKINIQFDKYSRFDSR